jgi:hypothetical protein
MRPSPRLVVRLVACATLLSACGDAPIDWTSSSTSVSPAGAAHFAVSPGGAIVADSMARVAEGVAAPSGPLCAGSLRVARSASTLHAVWWAPRADSGAMLLAARSTDRGRTWSAASPVDTLDQGVTGCRRAPPAIAADSTSGYVHVTYALHAPEGAGLFFSHSMDRGVTFHAPVAIFYGERLGRTSVAADGQLVVVGFEDPNSLTPRVGLALSRTMGHIFEHRLLPVSSDNGAATNPVVAVQGSRVAIAWEQQPGGGAPSGPPALAIRAGVVH